MDPDELGPGVRVHFGEVLTARRRAMRAASLWLPGGVWLLVFVAGPLLLLAGVSLCSRSETELVGAPLTLENFRRLMGFGPLGFDPWYPVVLGRSVGLGALTALTALLAGLPLAFFIAGLGRRGRDVALTLVVIPFWTNLLVRTYAWQLLLAPGGWLARVACGLGWVEPGAGLYPGFGAVWLGMLCDFLPFMVLPLYASVERLDWSLVEAARDLGAGRWTTFRHGLWPQLKPGLVTGWVLVFLPACGQFVIPDLLGGARTVLIGNAIQQQFGPGLDWPFGAAVAVVTLALVMAGLWLVAWAARGREMELP